MSWRAGWTVVSWANRSVGVPKCLALPRPATPPHSAPHRPARVMFGFWTRQVIGSLLIARHRRSRVAYVSVSLFSKNFILYFRTYLLTDMFYLRRNPAIFGIRLRICIEENCPERFFPDMPCMKKIYRDKNASVHWSAARNKERFSSRGSTADEPRVLSLLRFT